MAKKMKKPRNKRKAYFQLGMILFLLTVVGYGYLRVNIYLIEKKISTQKTILDAQNEQLKVSQNISEYTRLAAVRSIEANTKSIPWSVHIPKVIKMLEDLKSVDTNESQTIVLSDFVVNLDSISLKGKVSSLPLLYINSPKKNYVSLLDKFSQLDFIHDLRIQTYEKEGTRNFEFVLDAKVKINDTNK